MIRRRHKLTAHLLRINVAVLLVVFLSSAVSADQSERSGRIKAALVYYVAKFVNWPNEANDSKNPLHVCVAGDDDVTPYLSETLSNKEVRSRKIEISKIESDLPLSKSQLKNCDLLYNAVHATSKSLAQELATRPILTLCNSLDPAQLCMVRLFEKENRARIMIDPQAAKTAGLSISSELLEVAAAETPTAEH